MLMQVAPRRAHAPHPNSTNSGHGLSGALHCRELVRIAARAESGILITSYEQLRRQRAALVGVHWGYVVLDEGHKIRNPDAEVTLAAKQLPTVSDLTPHVSLCCKAG